MASAQQWQGPSQLHVAQREPWQVPGVAPLMPAPHVKHPFAHEPATQQTPSVQKPELHWVPAVQAVPFAALTCWQAPATHCASLTQSPLLVQVCLQTPAAHAKRPQLVVVVDEPQLWAPLQTRAEEAVFDESFEQVAAAHWTPVG